MQIKKIVVFHNLAGVGSAWCFAEGVVSVLQSMGYEVADAKRGGRPRFPVRKLLEADLILICGPEWLWYRLGKRYGSLWRKIPTLKVAWFVESLSRDDRVFDFQDLKSFADLHYFPAIQDAEDCGGTYLPFGVDTSIFRSRPTEPKYDSAFMGSLYPKREQYLSRVGFPLQRMQSVSSPDTRKSFELLAEAYRSTKIFVNLPALSRLLVGKVFEVMASGTFLLTPRLDHPSALANMSLFESGKHLVYYDPEKPEEIGRLVKYYLDHPEERRAIAQAGHDEVHKHHTLRLRLQKILDDASRVEARPKPSWWKLRFAKS
ncbi:MAG: glycosyltransferase [Xanthobacteraceae bacterium]|nr:glycosyltransferase [Xanthobacteraceae bacterium]